MNYPSESELLSADPLLQWIDEHFLRADPFAFKDSGFRAVISAVAAELDVEPNGIFCIGSGAIGLSLNPSKSNDSGRLKAFDKASDIDLAIISEVYFETAWRDIRRAAQPVLDEMDHVVRQHLDWQRKRFFDGAILTHKLLPALSFGPAWIASLVRISEMVAKQLEREVELNTWIYRDYWSLRNYVATGVIRCREKVS
jgi:hypothetical protein